MTVAGEAGYKRYSLSTLPRDPAADSCYMPGSQVFNPRKRQPTQLDALQLKRQKLNSTGYQPPAFWDSLSKIWLTKDALRELNRRNNQPASSQPRSQHRRARAVTRNFLAERKGNRRITRSASDFLRHCEPGTLKDIKLFARHGGPDLSDLKGVSITKYPPTSVEADDTVKLPEPVDPLKHIMKSSQSSSRRRKRGLASAVDTKPTTSTINTKTETSGPYNRNFEQKLIDGGVYPDGYEFPDDRVLPEPDNLEEIRERLLQTRSSLSLSQFSSTDFKEFEQANKRVSKENRVMNRVIPIIEGKIRDDKCAGGDIPFNNLEPLTKDSLTAAKPDLYYGAHSEQLNRQVRDELSGYIIPSTQHDLPIAPNFFLQAKGPDGSMAVARRQVRYDGALGAWGMHSLRSYGEDKPVYDNNAYTIMSTYHEGVLKLHTSHPVQPTSPAGQPEYCMTQLGAYAMTNSRDTFCQGAAAYRNARDWAKEQRDEAIKRANERVNDGQVRTRAVNARFGGVSSSTTDASPNETYTTGAPGQESQSSLNKDSHTTADHSDCETSMDELALDYIPPAKRSKHSNRSHQS